MAYSIKLERFEGPFDLLFHLIQKNEINIYDIPIAEITKQYIDYMNQLKENNLEITSEFIVLAANLLEIKSKMLLPSKKEADKEEDPRAELVNQLIEYKKIKELTTMLKEKEKESENIFFKFPDPIDLYMDTNELENESMLTGIKLTDVFHAFQRVLMRNEQKIDKVRSNFTSINKDLYTVEDKMEQIIDHLKKKKELEFFHLFITETSRIEVIVTFLALLELIKTKQIRIIQESIFSNIIIELNIQ